jgi:hypothetical protein
MKFSFSTPFNAVSSLLSIAIFAFIFYLEIKALSEILPKYTFATFENAYFTYAKYSSILGPSDYSVAIQFFDKSKFSDDKYKSIFRRIRTKFILVSISQKILIAIFCFALNT